MTLRVTVADDQELVRAGFRLILERAGIDVVGEAADGVVAVEQALALQPDVVLMDIRMPRRDGIEATRLLAGTSTRVLVLTTFDLDDYVYAAVRAGASGFLLKDVSPTDLVHAVHVVARGEAMLAPALTRRLLERFATPRAQPAEVARLRELSARETDVLRLIARGSSNAQIGQALFLSEATVKT